MRRLAAIALCLALSGCPAFWALAPRLAQGAQLVGSLLSVAEQGSELFSARNPNQERDQQIAAALWKARQALGTFNAALAAADSVDHGTVDAARDALLEAYEQLRMLLESFGVLDGIAQGGAEAEGVPIPAPFYLPSTVDVARAMGGEP